MTISLSAPPAAEWIDVGGLDDIPRRGARVVKTRRGDVAVFRTATDTIFAIDDRCPHRGGPLSQGIVHGEAVACPLHNWVIDLASGKALGADEGCVRSFPCKVQSGRVFLTFAAIFEIA